MEDKIDLIKNIINTDLKKIHELRWKIHSNPELGYNEIKTTNTLEDFFSGFDIKFNRFNKIQGGYVYIDNNKAKTIGLRADIDALPIEEETDIEFKSNTKGIMHACGHDVHTTIAAGTTLVLNNIREKLDVNVLIIFQPAEESNPTGGSKLVIKEGVLKKYNVTEFYGLHVWPEYKINQIGVKPGVLMGSSDKFRIKVKGKTAHAAQPYKGIDAISIAVDIVNGIEHKLRREIDPFDTALVSIGEFNSKGRYNIVCDEVNIVGTIRTIDEKTRNFIKKRIVQISENSSRAYNGSVIVEIDEGYSTVINDINLTNKFINHNVELLGSENVITNLTPSLIGEDFSAYSRIIDSVYFFLGCESKYPLHSNKFIPKLETIETGILIISNFILKL